MIFLIQARLSARCVQINIRRCLIPVWDGFIYMGSYARPMMVLDRDECLLMQVARSSGKNRCFARALCIILCLELSPVYQIYKANDLCSWSKICPTSALSLSSFPFRLWHSHSPLFFPYFSYCRPGSSDSWQPLLCLVFSSLSVSHLSSVGETARTVKYYRFRRL